MQALVGDGGLGGLNYSGRAVCKYEITDQITICGWVSLSSVHVPRYKETYDLHILLHSLGQGDICHWHILSQIPQQQLKTYIKHCPLAFTGLAALVYRVCQY